MNWEEIFTDKTKAVGEVAGVDNGLIEVFIYPEHYAEVKVGSVLVFDSEYVKPIGIVLNLIHRAKHGNITPLRKPRIDIIKAYPDIDKYHKYAVTAVYTSHYIDGKVYHFRGGMPKLHDLAFLVKEPKYLDLFFRPSGIWSLKFLEYYINAGADRIEIREFLLNHKEYLAEKITNDKGFLSELIRVLYKSKEKKFYLILEEISQILSQL